MTRVERNTIERAGRLRQMMSEFLRTRTPQERDRTVQVHLAQARGRARNGDLLRCGVDRMLRIRAARIDASGSLMMDDALVETLEAMVEALEAEGVRYAVTGSTASSVHGEPAMSQDVDLIVQASPKQIAGVADRLAPRFYAPADMLSNAAEQQGFTNVIDNRTSLKVDLSFVSTRGYLAEAMTRRERSPIGTASPEFWFVTPEDVILMKLLWRKDTRSTKQWNNALSVVRVQGARMNWRYLFDKARELGVEDDLITLRDEAGI